MSWTDRGLRVQAQEMRREARIKAAALPEAYRRFSILLSGGIQARVETIDASLNGFGFFSELTVEDFVIGSRLVLYPLGVERPLYGIVVHAAAASGGTRVGVSLQALGGYAAYAETLKVLVENIPT